MNLCKYNEKRLKNSDFLKDYYNIVCRGIILFIYFYLIGFCCDVCVCVCVYWLIFVISYSKQFF